jgi:hypothetical protein
MALDGRLSIIEQMVASNRRDSIDQPNGFLCLTLGYFLPAGAERLLLLKQGCGWQTNDGGQTS